MSNDATSARGIAVDVFSGLGLGLLLGVILGMAKTPVVATVVGALASLLAVFLGLEGGEGSRLEALAKVRVNGVRIGSFGLATVLGLYLGLYMRINNPVSDSPAARLAHWEEALPVEVASAKEGERAAGKRYAADEQEAGRNRLLAQQMMIYERTGLLSSGAQSSKGAAAADGEQEPAGSGGMQFTESGSAGVRLAVLFGNTLEGQTNVCEELDPEEFTAALGLNVDGWLAMFSELGFPTVYEAVSQADPANRESMLRTAHQALCDVRDKLSEVKQ